MLRGDDARPLKEAEHKAGLVAHEHGRTPFVFTQQARSTVQSVTMATLPNVYAERVDGALGATTLARLMPAKRALTTWRLPKERDDEHTAVLNLDRQVIAESEFAESQAIIDELRRLGVDYAQGCGVQRPTPLPPRQAAAQSQPAVLSAV